MNSKPYELYTIENLPVRRGFRDYAAHNILEMHRNFLKLKPVEPLYEEPSFKVKSVEASIENPHPKLTVRSCQYHNLLKPQKPCLDCFLLNLIFSLVLNVLQRH